MKSPFFFLLLTTVIGVSSCKKDEHSTRLTLKLTDSPAPYQEVNVDLKQINIRMSDDSTAWTTLPATPAVYNLLDLRNGLDTVIGEGMIPPGKIREIRLVLGSNNTVKVGDETYPLTIPSGSESGLKIKLEKTLKMPQDSILLDFDAALSVQAEEDGFKLRPVIRLVE